jgi:hypothetical protein
MRVETRTSLIPINAPGSFRVPGSRQAQSTLRLSPRLSEYIPPSCSPSATSNLDSYIAELSVSENALLCDDDWAGYCHAGLCFRPQRFQRLLLSLGQLR